MPQTSALPRWLRPANHVVRAAQRLGLPLGTIHVLTVPGRTSGKPRSTPVSPLTVNGRRFIIAALPHGDWARNVRAAGHGTLASRRRLETVLLREVADPGLRRTVLRAFPAEVPQGVRFFVQVGLVTGSDPDHFEAAAERVSVFEVIPATT